MSMCDCEKTRDTDCTSVLHTEGERPRKGASHSVIAYNHSCVQRVVKGKGVLLVLYYPLLVLRDNENLIFYTDTGSVGAEELGAFPSLDVSMLPPFSVRPRSARTAGAG